jgi:superfamily II DNA or RNA helicase
MPRYRFDWCNLPQVVLTDLAGYLDGAGTPAELLCRAYGARPQVEFVQDFWPELVEIWLRRDPESRSRVVTELTELRLGDLDVETRSAAGQLEYLRSCNNARRLREVVLSAFHEAGERTHVWPARWAPDAGQRTPSSVKPEARVSQAVRAGTSQPRRPSSTGSEGPSRQTAVAKEQLTVNTATSTVPEVGQVVRCRDRFWAVTDVLRSTLPGDPHDVSDEQRQHLVALSSIEDDGFGDEVTVIWEVEPGTEIREIGTLPRPEPGRFDDPSELDAFIDAVRWGAIASADSSALQAPFRSGITIEDYQLDPVVRALGMPRVNLLVADDVGLGKTIEAGLVIQELLLRHRARTVLIVCPASLCLKWQEEMASKFGLEFRVIDSASVKQLRRDRGVGSNVFSSFPRLIVSVDWFKRPRAQSLLAELLDGHDPRDYPRRFDLLVVDEVHTCAPSGRGKYATDSQRTRSLRALAPHFEHRLFLSATPHNGYSESFTALLEMLDPQRFTRTVAPSPEALQRAMVRRLKSELREELPLRPDGTPRFPERVVKALEVDYPADERRAHELLVAYTNSRRQQAASSASKTATDFITLLLKKRMFSSPAAFLRTLDQHLKTLAKREGKSAGDDALLRAAYERLEEEVADENDLEEVTGELLSAAARATEPLTAEQRTMLTELQAWAEREANRADAKTKVLIGEIERVCRPDGDWNDERVIVFTEYRDTQIWLQQLLTAAGLGGDRLELLYGGMDVDTRERVKAAFQAPPSKSAVRILLATDAASEGIDLQNHCWRVYNVETPYSPSRLEQRSGRVDRHGQPNDQVFIHHFIGTRWEDAAPGSMEADLEFLFRVAKKIDTIRDDIGSAGPVLADQVEEALLGRRRSIDDAPLTSAKRRAQQQVQSAKRKLRDEIAVLRAKLDHSVEELHVTPSAIEHVVAVGLRLGRQRPLLPGPWPSTFVVPPLTGTWARASIGLAHPFTGEIRPITFDNAVAAKLGDQVVLAHLGHRLVAQATRLLRAEVWATSGERHVQRVTARVAKHGSLDETAVVAHARVVLTGAAGHRLHEEIITAGGLVRNGRFARLNVGETKAALAASTDVPAPTSLADAVARGWDTVEPALYRSLEVRAGEVAESLQRELRKRADEDREAVRTVLSGLQKSIAAELEQVREGNEQLSLFSPDERGQLDRDIAALERRLAEIPDEIERELAAIDQRYADPLPRLFPAAVTILVPATRAAGATR